MTKHDHHHHETSDQAKQVNHGPTHPEHAGNAEHVTRPTAATLAGMASTTESVPVGEDDEKILSERVSPQQGVPVDHVDHVDEPTPEPDEHKVDLDAPPVVAEEEPAPEDPHAHRTKYAKKRGGHA